MVRAVALLAIQVFLDHPGLTYQEAMYKIIRRAWSVCGQIVWLGVDGGPEIAQMGQEEPRGLPLVVGNHALTPLNVGGQSLDMAIAELGRTGDFPVLVLNAHRFVHGMWAPRAIGDWLVDNPTARGAV